MTSALHVQTPVPSRANVFAAPALVLLAVTSTDNNPRGESLRVLEGLLQRTDVLESDPLSAQAMSAAPRLRTLVTSLREQQEAANESPITQLARLNQQLCDEPPESAHTFRLWLYSVAVALLTDPQPAFGQRGLSRFAHRRLRLIARALGMDLSQGLEH